jgi:SAM-dependent methyltransferase
MKDEDEYAAFAEWYDYIFPDWREWLDVLSDRIDAVFKSRGVRRVLDCACGSGVPSIGLALRGYEVTACDLSPPMIEKAEQNALELGATLRFCKGDMTDLCVRFERCAFDAIVCARNSISHLPTEGDRLEALRSMHAVLRDGGLLYLDARDWDATLAERKRVHLRTCKQFGSRHVTVLDVWDYHDNAVVFNIAVASKESERQELRVFPVTCYPFCKEAMNCLLKQAGFQICKVAHEPDRGFLSWRASKSTQTGKSVDTL